MYIKLVAVALLAVSVSAPIQAQAVFKCKTADGRTVIQDYPCGGAGTRTEDVRAVRQITQEEYNEAHAVHQMNKNMVNEADAKYENRQTKVNSTAGYYDRKAAEERRANECSTSLVRQKELGSRYRHVQEACAAGSKNVTADSIASEEKARADEKNNCVPTIINGNFDNCGNFYYGGDNGQTFRGDGKICNTVGGVTRCN
ncbi:MAG: DUF4124 domain-containing protein [Zoogloeaceae bacterium]|jgi:hypothetical protein|nr:DUF4124 domain-containing protein [Zoogloeaceae bacterium]